MDGRRGMISLTYHTDTCLYPPLGLIINPLSGHVPCKVKGHLKLKIGLSAKLLPSTETRGCMPDKVVQYAR